MIWSACREPVPPIFRRSARAASANSRTVFQGELAFTQSTNWSSASIATGVRSRQLKGTPVASGVVNRLDSVITILCGSPVADFMARKPSRSEEHTSELQSRQYLVCRLLLEKKKKKTRSR